MMNTIPEQKSMYSPRQQSIDYKFAPLLKDGERIAFDLENRCLVLNSDAGTQVARLSHTEAHLLLSLVHFYPYDAPDSLLAQGYLVDLSLHYKRLEREDIYVGVQEVTMPIANGIERLRRKISKFDMTISRMRNRGYVLRRGSKEAKTERLSDQADI